MFYVKVLGVYYLWPTEYNNKTSQSSFYQHAPFTQLDSKGERLSKIGKSYSARLSAVRNLSKISDDATFLDIFLQFKKYLMCVILMLTIIIQIKRMSSKQRVKRVEIYSSIFQLLICTVKKKLDRSARTRKIVTLSLSGYL